MPELPEVETTRRYLSPFVEGAVVERLIVRVAKLRWPVPARLAEQMAGRRILALQRRGKYLLFRLDAGTLIVHLGMTGVMCWLADPPVPGRHDHLDMLFRGGGCLRFSDPRRFGSILWTEGNPLSHPLLAPLGPEPLGEKFDGAYLFRVSRGRSLAVKQLIMDSHLMVGVGNIYACESLFLARIHPARPSESLSEDECEQLARSVRRVLEDALAAGGTAIGGLMGIEEKPGYFPISLKVYAREGEPCGVCGAALLRTRQGGRSTYFCDQCQL